MNQYQAIDSMIKRARIERSAYLGEQVADFFATTWKWIATLADTVGEGSQRRFGRNIFTLDA